VLQRNVNAKISHLDLVSVLSGFSPNSELITPNYF